jgi:archaellum component FlaC
MDHERSLGRIEASMEEMKKQIAGLFQRMEELQQRSIENRGGIEGIRTLIETISKKIDHLCRTFQEKCSVLEGSIQEVNERRDAVTTKYIPVIEMLHEAHQEKRGTWAYVKRGALLTVVVAVLGVLAKMFFLLPSVLR